MSEEQKTPEEDRIKPLVNIGFKVPDEWIPEMREAAKKHKVRLSAWYREALAEKLGKDKSQAR